MKLDFSNTSLDFLSSFGLPRKIELVKGNPITLNKIITKNALNIDFNALSSKNGYTNIKAGDKIEIKIEDKKYTMYYGKANETKVNGIVLGNDDTFLTIGDFLSKLNKKTGLNATFRDNKIYFKSKDDPSLSISSNNEQLLYALGVPVDLGKVDRGYLITGSELSTSTFAYSVPIFDKKGVRYFIQTRSTLIKKADKELNLPEVWQTSSVLLDKFSKRVDEKEYLATLKFEGEKKIPNVYMLDKNNKEKKVDTISISFLDNDPIEYNLKGTSTLASVAVVSSGKSRLMNENTDGSSSGSLDQVYIDPNGMVIAKFDNYHQEILGIVSVVNFSNSQGLKSISGNEYIVQKGLDKKNNKYNLSGDIKFMWNKDHATTKISSGRLEQSNVNLSVGLTSLIALQRAYSASSKAITASDEMVKEAINIKQ
jgi:flagellar hook-basal body protein